MPLPDEFDRLARRHLDGQIGLLYRDAADTADQVAGVEQELSCPAGPSAISSRLSDVTAR